MYIYMYKCAAVFPAWFYPTSTAVIDSVLCAPTQGNLRACGKTTNRRDAHRSLPTRATNLLQSRANPVKTSR